jgi:hypothetical protein
MNRRTYLTLTSVIAATLAGCSSSDLDENETIGDDQRHNVGDTFTVGDGDKQIEYTVTGWETYDFISGPIELQEPDGRYVVITMTIKNVGNESVRLSSNEFTLLDSQNREFDADTRAMTYLDSDGRIQADAINFQQVQPGLETSGAIVFDVGPGDEYKLQIEPAGALSTADPQYVELGLVETPTPTQTP